ncbi:hypothetical protein CL658_05160 [bacterium]|nr:hypothetical protein [bacterium]
MPNNPTIIIFDQESLFFNRTEFIEKSYSMLYCTSQSYLFSSLKKHKDSIKIIIYCAQFSMADYQVIQSIKLNYVLPEFILLSQDYAIDIFTEIAKLGIFSIHNISIHDAIIDLDIHDIFLEKCSYKDLLKKRLDHVLDVDLYITYKNLLADIQASYPHTHTILQSKTTAIQTCQLRTWILLIVDNQLLNSNLCTWLEKHAMSACPAYTAQQAHYLLTKQSFDLIILDLSLSDTHGPLIIQDLRSLNSTIPIILLTVYKDYDSLLIYMKEGAFEYITKPFNPTTLIQKIRHTLYFSQIRSNVSQPLKHKDNQVSTPSLEYLKSLDFINQQFPDLCFQSDFLTTFSHFLNSFSSKETHDFDDLVSTMNDIFINGSDMPVSSSDDIIEKFENALDPNLSHSITYLDQIKSILKDDVRSCQVSPKKNNSMYDYHCCKKDMILRSHNNTILKSICVHEPDGPYVLLSLTDLCGTKGIICLHPSQSVISFDRRSEHKIKSTIWVKDFGFSRYCIPISQPWNSLLIFPKSDPFNNFIALIHHGTRHLMKNPLKDYLFGKSLNFIASKLGAIGRSKELYLHPINVDSTRQGIYHLMHRNIPFASIEMKCCGNFILCTSFLGQDRLIQPIGISTLSQILKGPTTLEFTKTYD